MVWGFSFVTHRRFCYLHCRTLSEVILFGTMQSLIFGFMIVDGFYKDTRLTTKSKWKLGPCPDPRMIDDDNVWSSFIESSHWELGCLFLINDSMCDQPFFSLWSCHCRCCKYSEVCTGGEGIYICWGMMSCKSCTARKCTVSWWLVTQLWSWWLHWVVCLWDYCDWELLLKVLWSPFNHTRFTK